MRRRSRAPQDSLDLLLDTMCNAFGGIVLIAILVAILIESPSEDDAKNRPSAEETLQLALKSREVAEAEKELRDLQARQEEQKEMLELTKERNMLANLLEAQQETQNLSMVDLNDRLARALDAIARDKENVAGLSTETTLAQAQIEAKEKELEMVESKMSQLISSRMAETRPPELRDASGGQYNFIIRYGEIYPVSEFSKIENGELVGWKRNETSITWDDDSTTFPIEGMGMKIGQDSLKLEKILLAIKRHNEINSAHPSQRLFISTFVYGDSFHVLGPLRKMIHDVQGIQDGWNPIPWKTFMSFSTEGKKSQIN